MGTISSLSTEYILIQTEFIVGGVAIDPTLDTVQMAFTNPGSDPVGGDWVTGSWEIDSTTPSKPVRSGRVLVGPGGKVLAKGDYWVWLKVADNPEVPVKMAGLLQVV